MQKIPSSPTRKSFILENFLGVDFTSSPIEVDKRRSPFAKNMINNDGFNETRNGYKVLKKLPGRINGVWNIDTDIGDLFLVHAGTSLYQCTSNFEICTSMITGMADDRSTGIYFDDKLLIFDGNRVVLFTKFDTNFEARFLDTVGRIPTTSIARDKSGGGTIYEPINLMSPYRINTFLAEKIPVDTGQKDENGETIYQEQDQNEFILDDINIDEITLVEKLNQNGEWETVNEYEFSLGNPAKVIFTPGPSPVLGRDNVAIRYKKEIKENSDKINKCSIACLFGYEGNNNRIFSSGNIQFPNYDFHSEQDDPTYWPDENFTKIGTEPIINYLRLADGTLAIQKKHSDTDCTVYYRSYNLMNNNEVFPLTDGVKNIGCISRYANCNLLNDPLTLTEQGVFALIGNNGEKYAMQRSYYINGKLMKESNLENAVAISVLGKYYLAVNSNVYIADSRYISYPKHAKTEQYQYEWWFFDNLPVRVFFSWNNLLFFGTEDGKICKFSDDYLDDAEEIEAYWETPFLELDSSSKAKTIRNVTLILNPKVKSDIILGYELDDGTTEIVNKKYNTTDDFPKTISEKEKIQKFMFVKFFMKNKSTNKMSFERLILEYTSGFKYRGE